MAAPMEVLRTVVLCLTAAAIVMLIFSGVSHDLESDDSGEKKQSKTGNVGDLTDTSKYTGAHKARFDESDKGKGIEGQADRADNTGYVGNYKGQGTYDNK